MASEPPQPSPKPRRRPRWFKITVITVLVLANVAALGALWAIRTGQGLLTGAESDSDVAEVLDEPTGEELTFLLVGSDTRDGLEDLQNFGSFGGARADVIMLVKVGGTGSSIQMLSVPRDLWVEIPGSSPNRINAAYAIGGSRKLVETIRSNLDVEVNHYIEIDFVGFQGLIDELGGVEIDFPYPARDAMSGLDVSAGRQTLDGRTALAYARSRYYEEHRDGRWTYVDANDLGRTGRQQTVMRAMFSKLKSPSSITDAGRITGALARYMTVDSRLAGASVTSLAWDFRGVLTGNVTGATLPVSGRTIGGREVVVQRQPEADEMLAKFRSGQELGGVDGSASG